MMHPGNAPPMMHPTNAPPIMHTGNAPQAMDTNRPSQLKKIPVIDDSMESSPGKTKVTVAQFCPYHERSVFHTAEACRLNPTNQAKNPLSFATVSDTYNNYEKLRQTFQNTNYHTGYAKYRKFVSIVYGDTVSPEEFILKWRNALDDLMRNWGPSNMSYMFPFFQLITAISAHPETSAWLSTLNIEETTSTKGVLNSTIEKFIMAENTRLGIRPPGEEEGAVVPPATQYGWQPPPYYQQAYQGPVWVPQGYPGPVPPGPSAYGMQSPHSGYPDHGHY
ncbi:uncharacterized protein N7483_002253 [Penicillium malachiteum]|uniref:uncharacterized protein n=1 Tax=Penicillium malachiteum TaxID=1324776 RepID=UPI002546C3A8|nr:uncharacterized protein N7483_002253 [Penicillium malachiteum]KAJ5737128.1 hypothetical protein N7483_002253 [Penicillium malachiteum]